jgi:hypothetical protein
MSKDKHRADARLLRLVRVAYERESYQGFPAGQRGWPPASAPEIVEGVRRGLLCRHRVPAGRKNVTRIRAWAGTGTCIGKGTARSATGATTRFRARPRRERGSETPPGARS